MIQNLNPVSFRDYGAILPNRGQDADPAQSVRTMSLSTKDILIRQVRQQVWLCPEPGLCVLSVSRDSKEFTHFYLDKPLLLNAGIRFFLTPLQDSAKVRLSGQTEIVDIFPKALDFLVRPKLTVSRLYTFFYQEREQGFVFSGETHPMLELTYVDQGTLHSVADGQDLLLGQGDMVFYGSDQWHMHYADIGVAPRFVTVSFDAEGIDLVPLMNRKLRSSQKATTILRQMLSEQEHGGPYHEDMILALLTQLLLTLLQEVDNVQPPLSTSRCLTGENEIIRQAQQYISAHVRSKLSVPLVARNTDVSTSYLTALFHKHLQISPGEYIRRVKLQESKQMIREGNMNFTEIAEALQYSTIHHFSRQFKEKFGITPTEYAKSVK